MSDEDEALAFIRSSFRSVWDIEVLQHLAAQGPRAISVEELIADLRISHSVASQSLQALEAAGLAMSDGSGSVAFRAANQAARDLAEGVLELYRLRPDMVRRTIVSNRASGLAAFSDAFRWRR